MTKILGLRTEKRHAKVGERILITDAWITRGEYKNGNVLTVESLLDYSVRVSGIQHCIAHLEYEVIVEEIENGGDEMGIIEKMQAEISELKAKVAKLESVEGVANILKKYDVEGEFQPAKTPQQIRDEIVEKAKRDISELKTGETIGRLKGYTIDGFVCDAEFIINKEKRAVTVLLKTVNSKVLKAKGIAKCAPNDCFNAHIGKAIALRRALGLPVPSEYLQAPQPTEVRVGDVVYIDEEYPRETVSISNHSPKDHLIGFRCAEYWYSKKYVTIIDDSREGETK